MCVCVCVAYAQRACVYAWPIWISTATASTSPPRDLRHCRNTRISRHVYKDPRDKLRMAAAEPHASSMGVRWQLPAPALHVHTGCPLPKIIHSSFVGVRGRARTAGMWLNSCACGMPHVESRWAVSSIWPRELTKTCCLSTIPCSPGFSSSMLLMMTSVTDMRRFWLLSAQRGEHSTIATLVVFGRSEKVHKSKI